MLDKKIFSPFAITVAFFDGILHIVVIIAFRTGPAEAMFHLSSIDNSFRPQQYLVSSMILAIGLAHFSLNETQLQLAKYALSKRLFWSDMFSFWNLLKIVPIFMTALCSIAVDIVLRWRALDASKESDIPYYLRVAVALTTSFLWLRILAHIKMWFKELAAFILCSVEIMKDIKWFLLVLLIAMASFAQMFVSLTYEPHAVGTEQPDLTFKHFSLEGYLKAYTIMLGDFDVISLQKHPSIALLFILYTFAVTIVLLNVLIAIVSESYSNSMMSSNAMLGKARVMFVAEFMSLNTFHKLWREGKTGKKQQHSNLAAVAFGAFITKRVVNTLKTKLQCPGKANLFKENSLTASNGIFGSRGDYHLDVEAVVLFAILGSFAFILRTTLIHVQNTFDDSGSVLPDKCGSASAKMVTEIVNYNIGKLFSFLSTRIDSLSEMEDTKIPKA